MERVILHSDMNGFYASVECLYNPAIRDKPVAVGGDPESRHGIILAKNEIAKKFNIKTGEALWQALQKCPDLVIVRPHFERYLEFATLARNIYYEYTDQVEPFGLDEAWLDVSGSTRLFGPGVSIANQIRKRIRKELGITASVGVSWNKVFAKLGSDMKKPDATTYIDKDNYQEKVWPLPVSDLLYIGPATTRKLNRLGIYTIGELAHLDPKTMRRWFGKVGYLLWSYANGTDSSIVSAANAPIDIKSIGNSTTTPRNLETLDDVRITFTLLSESVAARLRSHRLLCNTIQIYIRDHTLFSFERQLKLPVATQLATEIAAAALNLFQTNYPGLGVAGSDVKPLRSLGVRACNLERETKWQQLCLFPEEQRRLDLMVLEHTIDSIRSRFGHSAIARGLMLTDRRLSKTNPREHIIHPPAWLRGSI